MEGVGSRTRAKRPNLEGDGDSAMDVKMEENGDASRIDESNSAMNVGRRSTPGQVSEDSPASTSKQSVERAAAVAAATASAAQQVERERRRLQARKKLEDDRKQLEQALWEDPIQIIPEVAMEVLVKFLNPVDKANLNKASRNAGKVLEKTSHKWRLREALLIPQVQQYLSNKDLLNFRVVCRDWKEALQHYLDTEHQIQADYSNYKTLASPSTACLLFRRNVSDDTKRFTASSITNSRKLKQLLTWTTTGNGNPFIGRSVMFGEEYRIIYLNGDDNEPELGYWQGVLRLLDRVGTELRFIVLKSPWMMQGQEFLQTIHQCLEKTPHLTTLCCKLMDFHRGALPFNGPCLPPLERLTRLHLNLQNWTQFQPFVPYLQQLTSLTVLDNGAFMDWYSPSVHTTFPNLVHLSVNVKNIANLAKLQSITGPLKEVKIRSEFSLVRLLTPLHILETFRGTMRVVALHQTFYVGNGNGKCAASGEDPARVDLPQLEALSINLGECGGAKLDTLLKLSQAPKYLELVVHNCHSNHPKIKRRNGTLKIYGLFDAMYKSNVWELWPDLQVVCVRRETVGYRSEVTKTHYTRKEWEDLQAEKLRKLQEKEEAKPKTRKRAFK